MNIMTYLNDFFSKKFNLNLLIIVIYFIITHTMNKHLTFTEMVLMLSLIIVTNILTRIKGVADGIHIGNMNSEMMRAVRKAYNKKVKTDNKNDREEG